MSMVMTTILAYPKISSMRPSVMLRHGKSHGNRKIPELVVLEILQILERLALELISPRATALELPRFYVTKEQIRKIPFF
jgi:hypothetical protein